MLHVLDGRPEATQVKLLGLMVSIHYKFDTHVDLITEKISSRNGQLANIAGIAGQDTLNCYLWGCNLC